MNTTVDQRNSNGTYGLTISGHDNSKDNRWTYIKVTLTTLELEKLAANIADKLASAPKPVELKEPEGTHTTVFDPFSIPPVDPELKEALNKATDDIKPAVKESLIDVAMKTIAGRVAPLSDEGPGYGD